MVRAVKEALRAAIFREKLTKDQINTALVEAEAIINSRPMAMVTEDSSDPLPVSPGMLLTGYDNAMDPFPGDLATLDAAGVQLRWRRRLHLRTVLSRKFVNNYIMGLRQRKKWHQQQPELQPGQLVLLDEPTKRLQWPLGRVVQVHPGRDGVVRSATIRLKTGIKKRPIQRLVPLEISDA